MTQIQHYIDKISQCHQSGKATEHSYRGDLQNLLASVLPDIAVKEHAGNKFVSGIRNKICKSVLCVFLS